MKAPYALAAILAILVLSLWFSCGNSSGDDSEYDACNVTYYPNGAVSGSVPTDSADYAAGAVVTVKGNTGGLAKTGYAYSGWNTKANGSGTTYTQGQTLTLSTSDVGLYAKWTANSVPTYTVTYNVNGATVGTAPVDTTNYEAGQTVTVQADTGGLVKTGYVFAGWNTASDGSGTTYVAGTTFAMGSSNMTLYARWGGAGYQQSYSAGGITFKMNFVPGSTGFPTGTDDSGTATVASPYWMAETEVTYELWYAVRTWAASNGYTFANPGREGNDGTIGALPTGAQQEPVTTVNWRDALVWCNALTEWYNANNGSDPDLDPVYYTDSAYTVPLRAATDSGTITDTTPGSQDMPYIKAAAGGNTDQANCTAKGFRLSGIWEWELAARWRTDGTNTMAGYSDPWFTQGDSASGATADNSDSGASGAVAWYSGNSGSASHDVKGKAADSLGLYDMSGNVWEWSFDWHPSYLGSARVLRGGSWGHDENWFQIGLVNNDGPIDELNLTGFRFARSQ